MAKKQKKMCACPPDPLDRARGILSLARTCAEKQAAAGYVESLLEAKAQTLVGKRHSKHEDALEHFNRVTAMPMLQKMQASIGRSCGSVPNTRFERARGDLFGYGR